MDENNHKKFTEYREEILNSLNQKLKSQEIKISEEVTLVDGFVMQSLQDNLHDIELGGPAIPSIMLVGKSGQIYLFALKVILPSLVL